MNPLLRHYHLLIAKWFQENVGNPTEIQSLAWQEIAKGEHVLVSAPTGSGKTLTAFLWAINQLAEGKWELGKTSVLYVSPLKALNNDIYRNLLKPLSELEAIFQSDNQPFPKINVMTRSGDTDSSDRNRMIRKPPEILIITPESLNLLLSSPRARFILQDLKTVIIDEVHATAGSKRGTHLMTAVERLTLLSGEFQRIALSATIKPLETIAQWVGGYRMERTESGVKYIPRTLKIIESKQAKDIQIQVQFPAVSKDQDAPFFWKPYIQAVKSKIQTNRSTLIFTNNRCFCERLSYLLNEDEPQMISYSHHGSLSRETREVVEQKLKNGELSAIVATSSLEMGIDIGALDEVLMIQPPWEVSSALQRVGRSGHGVGETSRGVIYTVNGKDLLNAAVICRCVLERDIEPVNPVECPLDLLVQIVVSMTGVEEWHVDDLYDFLRSTSAYHKLTRHEFELVLSLLEGKYASNRLRHIHPMILYDRMDGMLSAKPNALYKVYSMGGTIPDRGYFALRHKETRAKIGELDEEFVWERSKGDTFTFGTQVWRIFEITNSDVIAMPSTDVPSIIPFWKQEEISRQFHLHERVGNFLEMANRDLKSPHFKSSLLNGYCMDETAASALTEYLHQQRQYTKRDLPHRHHVLVEHTTFPGGKKEMRNIVLHTFWGSSVNRPFSLALEAYWNELDQGVIKTFANNECIVITTPYHAPMANIFLRFPVDDLERLLRLKLESSGFFGAHFRENAGRALMLPRGRRDVRTPLWLHRLRAKELLDATSKFADFPLLLETWRECLQDEFELDTLRMLLQEIQSGVIALSEIETPAPSPFCSNIIWKQTNVYMYGDDSPYSGQPSNLRDDLISGMIRSPELRPEIPVQLTKQLEERLQRIMPGYVPSSMQEWLDWVKERLLIPLNEWERLKTAIAQETDALDEWLNGLSGKMVKIQPIQTSAPFIMAVENLPLLINVIQLENVSFQSIIPPHPALSHNEIKPDIEQEALSLPDFLRQWLAYYAVLPQAFLQETLGLDESGLQSALDELDSEEDIVMGWLTENASAQEICDRQNFERLLRLKRRQNEPRLQPQPPETLALLFARQQGLANQTNETELPDMLEHLLGLQAPAEMWEKEILPARLPRYIPAELDRLMSESGLMWMGCGKEKVTLCFPDQIDVILQPNDKTEEMEINTLFADPRGKYAFSQLLEQSGLSSADLTQTLWEKVWDGKISNDSMAALRMGIESNFAASEIQPSVPARHSGFSRWKSSRPFAGNWFLLSQPIPPDDPLDDMERRKERARILLDRYGIVFRDLLARELPALRWGEIFKALRIMELSGEIVGGYFIDGVMGVQFAALQTIHILQRMLDEDAVYWMNAADPASLCGIAFDRLPFELPERRAGNHLVFHGKRIIMISKRQGKELQIHVKPDDIYMPKYFGLFETWLNRAFQPMKAVVIESINGARATGCEYIPALKEMFQVTEDYKQVTLRKKYS